MDEFTPRVVNHTLKNCPLCNTKRLKRLPNHLRQVHGIKDTKEWIQKAKESETDDTDEEIYCVTEMQKLAPQGSSIAP